MLRFYKPVIIFLIIPNNGNVTIKYELSSAIMYVLRLSHVCIKDNYNSKNNCYKLLSITRNTFNRLFKIPFYICTYIYMFRCIRICVYMYINIKGIF